MLAAIASLSQKLEMFDANLSEKLDDVTALHNQSLDQLNTLSNKLDRLTEKMDIFEDHLLDLPQQARPAAGPVAAATPAAPWNYSAELKARVYAAAYKNVSSSEVKAYTKRESPDGDMIGGSLFNIVRFTLSSSKSTTSRPLGPNSNSLLKPMVLPMLRPRGCTTSS
ncbi:uncharacterized protein MELLADRAFT_55030 [Melampsora larici-populina 98AG31]|uniref:Uncharacterized protein n=1 Tax=Melampsora larici-populina (strain 98AG31 / pathotype 3-4-7) TaxID=747676 RepID=F4RA92_MELLP|nr:uncharacterized protein MELLADRAFT_55030 [Melampsora larici-populina 98AG31]EGG10820.1 hypothetical protein MELLADRAFT_55030 [Melampsora larici-populina 98AG31]